MKAKPFKKAADAEKELAALNSYWSKESTILTRMSLLNLQQNEQIITILQSINTKIPIPVHENRKTTISQENGRTNVTVE